MEVADIDQPENPNPEIIQDRGRQRLANLLEKGNTELLDQPAVDTTELPPAYEQPQDQPEAADPVNSETDQTQQ